jgi:PAS domain-containing protein
MTNRKCIAGAALLVFLALFRAGAESPPSPSYVDLRAYPLYAKAGFDLSDTLRHPSGGGWEKIEGSPVATPASLKLDSPRAFLSPFSSKEKEFAFVIPFTLDGEFLAAFEGDGGGSGGRVPGIFLASLGDNWEIYLNGRLLKREMHLDSQGSITAHRGRRHFFFPADIGFFKRGENILAFRIVGDPGYERTGFFYAAPYYIDDYARIARRNNEALSLALIGVYLFMGLYHLVLFFSRRKDRSNLYYGLFSTVLGFFFLARTDAIHYLISDSLVLSRLEYFCVFLVLPLGASFLETVCHKRIFTITRIYGLFYALLALLVLFVSPVLGEDLLSVWQLGAIAAAFIILVQDIAYSFIIAARDLKRRMPPGSPKSGIGMFFRTLVETPEGNLIIGAFISISTGVADVIDAIFFHFGMTLTRYGFFIFTMAAALILARRFAFLYNQLNIANATLEKTNKDLEKTNQVLEKQIRAHVEANIRIQENEIKYRSLYEGTRDPVVLLDMNLCFKQCNNPAMKFFNLEGTDFSASPPVSLPDRLYEGDRDRDAMMGLFNQCIAGLKLHRRPMEITTFIKNSNGERQDCFFHMQYITTRGDPEIMIRVYVKERSSLVKNFVSGWEEFRIPNTIEAAYEVCRFASARLTRYLPQNQADLIAGGVREMVINAMEYGNLEISKDEKSKALEEKTYFALLQARSAMKEYRDRWITVRSVVHSEKARFVIRDEGRGFDQAAVFLGASAFDLIHYSETGNEVTLEKDIGLDKS